MMADDRENDVVQPEDEDPVVAEVRRAREALFSQFNFDLRAFCKFLQEQTEQTVRPGKLVVPSRASAKKAASPDTKRRTA